RARSRSRYVWVRLPGEGIAVEPDDLGLRRLGIRHRESPRAGQGQHLQPAIPVRTLLLRVQRFRRPAEYQRLQSATVRESGALDPVPGAVPQFHTRVVA